MPCRVATREAGAKKTLLQSSPDQDGTGVTQMNTADSLIRPLRGGRLNTARACSVIATLPPILKCEVEATRTQAPRRLDTRLGKNAKM